MRARGLLAICVVVAACDSGSSSTSTGTGGTPAAGGTTASGGRGGSGGATSVGGATGTGGVSASGGTSSGGSTALGGATSSGGVTANGGSTGTNGGSGTGGRAGAGGSSAPRSDAGSDSGRTDAGAGGGGSGGAGGTGGGAGGARPDAGSDARPDARPDAPADAASETGQDGVVSDGRTTSDGAPCPYAGQVTYKLVKSTNPSSTEQAAYPLITAAMDQAVYYYNCYANITKALQVIYDPSVATANGNYNGTIRFGPDTGYMVLRVAVHEISHTVGVGQVSGWAPLFVTPAGGGTRVCTGTNATAELRAITGDASDELYGDDQHFWPYGLNLADDPHAEPDIIAHCRIVTALRKDLRL